jgi:hypothetical protein
MAIFWWYRLRDAGRIAGKVASKVGTVRGNMRRKALRSKAGMSPITAIDNPLIAAATLMFSTQSEEFVLGDGDEQIIQELLLSLADQESVEEAMIYSKWAITQIGDPNMVIDKLGVFLKTQLEKPEKLRFLELLSEANSEIGGCYNFAATSKRLSRMMGLQTTN